MDFSASLEMTKQVEMTKQDNTLDDYIRKSKE